MSLNAHRASIGRSSMDLMMHTFAELEFGAKQVTDRMMRERERERERESKRESERE